MQWALLLSVAAPTLAAAVLLALGRSLGSKGERADRGRWALSLVAPVGALAAYLPVRGVPRFPPTDASIWSLWLGLAAGTWVAVEGANRPSRRVGWAARAVAALGVVALVSWPLMQHSWSAAGSVGAVVLGGGLLVGLVALLERRARALPGPAVPLAMAFLAAGTAGVLGSSGTALLAQTAGGAALALGVVFLFALGQRAPDAEAAVAPAIVLVGGLAVGGAGYAEVSAASLALLVVAALAGALIPLPVAIRTGWKAAASLALIVVALSAGAIGVALAPGWDPTTPDPEAGSDAEDEAYDGYGY